MRRIGATHTSAAGMGLADPSPHPALVPALEHVFLSFQITGVSMKNLLLAAALLLTVAVPAQAGCRTKSVSLYGAYWCPACASAKRFLSGNNINYRYIEVTNNRQAQKTMLKQFGMV